jgi:hypothetical protein
MFLNQCLKKCGFGSTSKNEYKIFEDDLLCFKSEWNSMNKAFLKKVGFTVLYSAFVSINFVLTDLRMKFYKRLKTE